MERNRRVEVRDGNLGTGQVRAAFSETLRFIVGKADAGGECSTGSRAMRRMPGG